MRSFAQIVLVFCFAPIVDQSHVLYKNYHIILKHNFSLCFTLDLQIESISHLSRSHCAYEFALTVHRLEIFHNDHFSDALLLLANIIYIANFHCLLCVCSRNFPKYSNEHVLPLLLYVSRCCSPEQINTVKSLTCQICVYYMFIIIYFFRPIDYGCLRNRPTVKSYRFVCMLLIKTDIVCRLINAVRTGFLISNDSYTEYVYIFISIFFYTHHIIFLNSNKMRFFRYAIKRSAIFFCDKEILLSKN